MATFAHLFRHYVDSPQQGRVMINNVHDEDYLTHLSQTTKNLTIYHCDFTVLETLKRTLELLHHVTISDRIFPPAYTNGDEGYDLAIVQIPISPSFAIGLIASALVALNPDGRLIAAGNKRLGGRTTVRKLQALMPVTILDESGDDIIFCVVADALPELPADWYQAYQPQPMTHNIHGREYTTHTQPGIFSWHRLDPGPAYFLKHINKINAKPGGRILDAGCGYGLLGLVMHDHYAPDQAVWVDKNLIAVNCTRLSIPRGGIALGADLLYSDFSDYQPFDTIFCVPPFYDAYTEGTGFMEAFAPRAGQMLSPDGILVIVANRVLKFHQVLEREYPTVEVIDDGGNFQMMIAHLT